MSYASVFSPGLHAGQVALVTGAGSGMGRCALGQRRATEGGGSGCGCDREREELPRRIIAL